MALQHSFTAADGTVYPEAYSRVVHILTYKNEGRVFVNTYENQSIREQEPVDSSIQPVGQKEYVYTTEQMSGDQFPVAYLWLKAEPEFVDSIDC